MANRVPCRIPCQDSLLLTRELTRKTLFRLKCHSTSKSVDLVYYPLNHAPLAHPSRGSSRVTAGTVRFTGCGPKYRGARGQPRTRGPEADETKTMTVAWPHHACVPLSERRTKAPSSALDLYGCIQRALLATRRQHGVQVQEQLCRRALHARADGLDAADDLLCEGAVCTRVCDRVLRRCHAAPKRCGSELELWELATQAHPTTPASPIVAS